MMEDGVYVQGVAAILSFQDLLAALVHVWYSVHLGLGGFAVQSLPSVFDDNSNLVLSALGFNKSFDVC